MNTVILCNDLVRLRSVLKPSPGPLRFLSLVETRESTRICSYLRSQPDAEEISRAQVFHQPGRDFRRQYVEFMGELNAANASLGWWAMPFTNKNPLATSLCQDTSHFLSVAGLLGPSSQSLVVITDSRPLAAQVEEWGRAGGIQVVNLVKDRPSWRRTFKEYAPGAILAAFLKTLWIWAQARRQRPSGDPAADHTVVATVFHRQSFPTPGEYKDVYFGRLVDDLPAVASVVGLLQEGWRAQLAGLKSLKGPLPVVPIEAYLSLWDIVKCGLRAVKAYFTPPRIDGPVEINGLSVASLVRGSIRDARRSGNILLGLRVYYGARRLARSRHVTRCLYPYENRAWEKMLVLGIRSQSPKTRMVGYQHASITLSHTNFFLGQGESPAVPLPDAIATTGPVVKEWLEREGNYPPGLFQAACALRQNTNGTTPLKARGQRIKRVLVALATNVEEYVGTLIFLEAALAGTTDYDVRVRPHPTIPLDSALELAPLSSRDFYTVSTGPLDDAFQWADLVIYASSTVGMEAVAQGIPAIYLDLRGFLDTDPMAGWDGFKWSVRDPAELVETIVRIEALPDEQFQAMQRVGQQYVASYLSPVSETGLRVLLEA